MLAAANRLRTAADFQETTRRGVKSARGCVVVYVKRSDSSAAPRVGLIVTKSVGGSVARHRTARRIRAAVRPLLTELSPGATMVVRALPGADRSPRLADDLAVSVRAAVAR